MCCAAKASLSVKDQTENSEDKIINDIMKKHSQF